MSADSLPVPPIPLPACKRKCGNESCQASGVTASTTMSSDWALHYVPGLRLLPPIQPKACRYAPACPCTDREGAMKKMTDIYESNPLALAFASELLRVFGRSTADQVMDRLVILAKLSERDREAVLMGMEPNDESSKQYRELQDFLVSALVRTASAVDARLPDLLAQANRIIESAGYPVLPSVQAGAGLADVMQLKFVKRLALYRAIPVDDWILLASYPLLR